MNRLLLAVLLACPITAWAGDFSTIDRVMDNYNQMKRDNYNRIQDMNSEPLPRFERTPSHYPTDEELNPKAPENPHHRYRREREER